jgi:hypothetical protein
LDSGRALVVIATKMLPSVEPLTVLSTPPVTRASPAVESAVDARVCRDRGRVAG